MKRAVICTQCPQDIIPQLDDYSIMIIDPRASQQRRDYLLAQSDYSLLITDQGEQYRTGGDYANERLLWYTSGTTGDSKFCSFSQDQVDTLAKTICDAYELDANDRYVSVMSLSHAHGQGFYWAAKRAGCQIDFLSLDRIRHLADYAPTFVTAIPGLLKIIANIKLNNLRFIRSASAPLPDALYHHLASGFGVPVIEAFGMTEALSHCFTNPLRGPQHLGTVGLPSGIEAMISDQRLMIRGPCVYHTGWFDTGDLAEQDPNGYYRIIGRHRDQINVNGYKLNPASIENQLLNRLPQIGSCVIYGSHNVKCLYTGACDTDHIQRELVAINRHCRAVLIQQVDEIPMAPSGKISRTWLEQTYQ